LREIRDPCVHYQDRLRRDNSEEGIIEIDKEEGACMLSVMIFVRNKQQVEILRATGAQIVMYSREGDVIRETHAVLYDFSYEIQ
jgi:hypothetical protein